MFGQGGVAKLAMMTSMTHGELTNLRRIWMTLLTMALALVIVGCGNADQGQPVVSGQALDAESDAAPVTIAQAIDTENSYGPTLEGPPSAPAASPIEQLLAQSAPVNLAHAGGDQSWPHSTAYAFAESVRVGADVLEMDVRLTADGKLVVHHDDTVDRTTEVTGRVDELTLAELQALDNAYRFRPGCWACAGNDSSDFPLRGVRTGDQPPPAGYTADDFRIATFEEIATRFPDMVLDVEIKGNLPGAGETARVLADEIEALGRTDSTVVVSFDDAVVDIFHELAPEVEVSPGLDRLTTWFLSGEPLEPTFRIIQVPPFSSGIQVITAETVARAHAEGLEVWAWADDAESQENAEFYQEMLDLGVDGFIVGRPELFAALQ